jgi:hypothetical protein
MTHYLKALLSGSGLVAIAVVAAGCQGPPGPAGPQGPAGPPGSGAAPQVVDSTAQVVGEYLHSADVKITAGAHTFGLGAQATRLFGRVELHYTGAGCTGTPFIWAPAAYENLLPIAAIGQAQMAYIPDPAAAVSTFTQTSKIDNTGACVAAGGGSVQGKSAIAVLDLSPFVAPFSLTP